MTGFQTTSAHLHSSSETHTALGAAIARVAQEGRTKETVLGVHWRLSKVERPSFRKHCFPVSCPTWRLKSQAEEVL